MKTPDRILELLYDRQEGFWLLEELTAAAGVGRGALDRALSALSQRGQRLEFSPAAGVRVVRPVALNANLIERNLPTRRVGRNVICFPEVDSTNDVAFDSARQSGSDGLAVLAESQRSGRGRHGRRWQSPPGANVLMSVLLIDQAGKLAHEALTIAAGLAVAEGVEATLGLRCQLKWPNDVLLEGGKLAGVLVEVRRVAARRCVVAGMGINVNAAPPASQIGRAAACLSAAAGGPVERTELIRCVLLRLDEWVHLIAAGEYERLHEAWLKRCGMINERHAVRSAGKLYEGRVIDVRPLEGLVLLLDGGATVRLPAETSTVIVEGET